MHPQQTPREEAESLYYAALDAIAAGDPEAAIRHCHAAIALAPDYLDARHALVSAFQDAGRFEDGIVIAQGLTELDPDDVLAYTSLSILYQRKGMVAEAEAAAMQAKLRGWKQQLRAGKSQVPPP